MSILGLALIVALCIPIVALVVDSSIGRGLGERLQRTPAPPGDPELIRELSRRLELVEGDVESLQQTVGELHDENQFLQRLLAKDDVRDLPAPKDGA